MLLNCGAEEDSWECLGQQGDQTNQSKGNQPWIFIGRTNAEAEAPILRPPDVKSWHFRNDWCWERLKAGGEGNNRGWDGWMASLTQWTWVWVDSGSWWWTGRPGVLQSTGSQRVRHDWVTEQQLTFWHTWPRGLEVEPESCSSWRLMSPVAAFEPFWFAFPQWGVSLLPRTAMLSDATREQLLRDQPIPAESRHWQGQSSSRGGLWGAVVSWGVSTEWKKKSIVLSKRKERGPHEGQPGTKSIEHPRPNLWPPPFKVPEHHVMLGTVQAESWFDLPHCFLQLDGHWTILVFLSIFCPHSSLRCGGWNSVCKLGDLDYDSTFANSSVTLGYILVFLHPQFPY